MVWSNSSYFWSPLSKHLENIHSICWDDQSERSKKIDPELQRKGRASRNVFLPSCNQLCVDLSKNSWASNGQFLISMLWLLSCCIMQFGERLTKPWFLEIPLIMLFQWRIWSSAFKTSSNKENGLANFKDRSRSKEVNDADNLTVDIWQVIR
jgi:hypothetical protein